MSQQQEQPSFKDWINQRIAKLDEANIQASENGNKAKALRFNMRAFELEVVRSQLEKMAEVIEQNLDYTDDEYGKQFRYITADKLSEILGVNVEPHHNVITPENNEPCPSA